MARSDRVPDLNDSNRVQERREAQNHRRERNGALLGVHAGGELEERLTPPTLLEMDVTPIVLESRFLRLQLSAA